jgi:hypothetical protein
MRVTEGKLMSDINDLLPALEWFRGAMVTVLANPKNIAKPDWRNVSAPEYLRLLKHNMEELDSDINAEDCGEVIARSIDVANLAMMLAAKSANDGGCISV